MSAAGISLLSPVRMIFSTACSPPAGTAAAKLQDRVIRLNAVLSGPNSLACYKAGLVRRGVIAHRTLRSPLTELAPAEEEALLARLEEMDYTNPCG